MRKLGFYRDTIRTARKEHKCTICHGIIKPGEKYHDRAGNSVFDEDVIYWGKECMACQPVIKEFCQSDCYDEGYCDEYIQEWWRNEKCYDCQHYFLPCDPDEQCKKLYGEYGLACPNRTKYGTCKDGDTCDDMTHYCRCEKYKKAE